MGDARSRALVHEFATRVEKRMIGRKGMRQSEGTTARGGNFGARARRNEEKGKEVDEAVRR
eukprot:816439-Pleurochrysis_carterae.AAC.1